MFGKSWLVILLLGAGFALGLLMNRASPLQSARAQETANAEQTDRLLIQGQGRAISTLRPPGEQFTLIEAHAPRTSFKTVPQGKKFVLTDAMYIAQGSVRQPVTVNIADAMPGIQKQSILFQVRISPGESDQVHLCSGYIIPSGHALVAYTNAGLEPEQYVSISVTGYLADE
ncbi:MAG TPA: hypothetical protein VF544_12170 [Pyrinomonadaceae bacterium]|jgi:hypothetical protein